MNWTANDFACEIPNGPFHARLIRKAMPRYNATNQFAKQTEADMPKPEVKVKFPKGTKNAPGKAGITYNKQGPTKRRAVLDADINGNSTKVTIEYDYPSVPPELLALIDAQYADAVVQLNGQTVTTAAQAMDFLNLATSILSDAIAEGVASYEEA